MFAVNARIEFVTRVSVILAIFLSALVPSGVTAASLTISTEDDALTSSTTNQRGIKAALIKSNRSLYFSNSLQDITATPALTDTPTIEPSSIPLVDNTETPTAVDAFTPAVSVTSSLTPTPSQLPVSTATPSLSAVFSAYPPQAQVGDQVLFTLELTNDSQFPITGLHFEDILPNAFTFIPDRDNGFAFNPQTRELKWITDPAARLDVGEVRTLTYRVLITSAVTEGIQVIDTATVGADSFPEPLLVETELFLSAAGSALTRLEPAGGQATGLGGRLQLNFPADSVERPAIVAVRELSTANPNENDPWIQFELSLQIPASETAVSMPASIPNTTEPRIQENDQVVPLTTIETPFAEPIELVVSFAGLADLSTLNADQVPFLVTLEETSGTWIKVPLKSIDRNANTISADLSHFSTWGIGIGYAFPQNGAGVLMFDRAYSSLFTGSSQYSLPIWTPPGRHGMAPSLSLSYSSGTANGLLGDIQAPWVGMGWNIDSVEIARKITNGACSPCGGGSYGYENKFLLLFNGTGYELIPDGTTAGRYHTKSESFLYIQLHNNSLGNNSPAALNATGEWWEVVEKNGTRWRLGWDNTNAKSEQLAAMLGYPGAATGAWATLGYAGAASNVVASRWRADQVTDTFGNRMTLSYFEENRLVAGTSTNYDRASYLDTITYTLHTSGTPTAGYSVVFVRESRSGSEVPLPQNDWDNWDTYRLDRIDVKYGAAVVRSYDLGYTVNSYTDDAKTWQTTVLSSVALSGGTTTAPTTIFSYVDQANRANCGAGCQEWAYPRLLAASNGWGASTTFTYENDGRPSTSWYNWRVSVQNTADGVNASPMKTTYSYSTPCYNDTTAGWCNVGNVGELIGYGQTTATVKDFNGTTTLAISVHKFHTDEQKSGREYEVQNQNAAGTILSQTNTTYTVATSGLPVGGYFTYRSQVDQYLRTTTLVQVSSAQYQYDTTIGNVTLAKEYSGAATLYRQTVYQYITNTSPSVWILDKVSRRILQDASFATVSTQEYGYDDNFPASGSLTVGKLTLSRRVSGTQTVDTKYLYDSYGNVIETRRQRSYGSTGSLPSGTYLSYANVYDTALKTYPTSVDTPLIPATAIGYDYGLGLPTTVTDPNNSTTTTVYDGLGRVTSIKYQGYAQPNIKYTYPVPTGSPLAVAVPFAIKAETWDEPAAVYRTAWQVMDGLGRVIQTQSPYETAGMLVLNDTSYNARGLTLYQGLPRTLTGTGGSFFTPTWGTVPHTTAGYDALARISSLAYPDSSSESFSYSGLRTTAIDRNSHQKIQEMDAFGRLVKVEEYTGSNPYTLYASTQYAYEERDYLKTVTDAAGNQTTISYNAYGRKQSITDPDMGNWRYRYDAFDNLIAQIDAKRQAINMYYDDLNRPIGKTYDAGPVDPNTYTRPSDPGYAGYIIKYYYDTGTNGYGRRTRMEDPSGFTTWTYNALGQITNETHNIDSTDYSMGATYDAFGRPLTQTLPSAEVLNYAYNAMGSLSSLSGTSTYVSQIHYSESGQVTDQLLGNGLVQQSCYDTNTLRLTSLRYYSGALQICGTTPASPRLNLSFGYQANGNVSQITDATRSETLTYTYDELDRLTSATGPYNYSYAYNTIGNITRGGRTNIPSTVTTGYHHTCAINSLGGVMCWGRNGDGQLGDGTATQRVMPVDVSGLTSGVTAITAGNFHTCALTSAGGVKCWGKNSNGQLGNGSWADSNIPVSVSGLSSGVTAIAAGTVHTCALLNTGGVKCWGDNLNGQLGDTTWTDRNTPVSVNGLTSGIAAITAGGDQTCALLTTGALKCWGYNSSGQVGDGTTTSRNAPVPVSGLASGVASVEAGSFHTCAVLTTGALKCWGRNDTGQVGDGTTTNRNTPTDVSGLGSGVAAVSAGGFHTCARTTSGGIKCWGSNVDGEVGDGTTTQRNAPVDVSSLTSGVTALSSSYTHSCVLTTTSQVKCWGKNDYNQLSDASLLYSATALLVVFPTTYTYGDTAHKHAVTALNSGESYTYDANGNMITRVEGGFVYNQTFDIENRLVSVTVGTQTTQFIYDGDGNLVKKVNPDGSRTIYVGGVHEVDKTSGGTVTHTRVYYLAAGAMRVDGTRYYVLKDHLGSASVVTNQSATTVGEDRFYPFGETRFTTGNMQTDQLFTGQREITALGIYHYGARFYSPKIGHFLSADTLVPGFANPQNLNRFSYVQNNPIRYSDPSGHMVTCGDAYDQCGRTPPAVPPPICTTCGGTTGNAGRSEQENSNDRSEANNNDDGIVIPFDTNEIVDTIPGTAEQWANGASIADEIALTWDTLLGVYVLTWVGVGLAGGLTFEGNPVTGLAGATAGYIVGEGSVFASGALFPGNLVASAATVAGTIADAKSGNTSVNGQLIVSSNGINLTADGQIASTTLTSISLSSVGWAANLVVLSLPLQIAAVENDQGTFDLSNMPVDVNFSFP